MSGARKVAEPAEYALISTEAGGRLLGITGERVRQLTKDGAIRKKGRDSYRIIDLVQGYLSYLRDEDRQSSKTAVANRLQEKKIVEADLRIAEKTKILLVKAQAEALAVIDEFSGGLLSDLRAIPAQVTDDVDLRRKITDRVDVAFGAAAKRAAAEADLVEAAGADLETEGEAEPGRMGEEEPGLSG